MEDIKKEDYKELDPIAVFVLKHNEILLISEGSGCNLSKEDIENGMKDYINIDAYTFSDGVMDVRDGGELLYEYYIRDKHSSLEELIPDALTLLYNDKEEIEYTVLDNRLETFEQVKKCEIDLTNFEEIG